MKVINKINLMFYNELLQLVKNSKLSKKHAAIIVSNNKIIAMGYNTIKYHAEVMAIQNCKNVISKHPYCLLCCKVYK
jgi:deoxycytidylate deaminase